MSGNIVSLASRHQGSPSKSAIAEGIRARIRSGELPLGARISDKVIASELGISRTPVREALVQLQTEGLVVIRPQSGTFVTDLTPTDVHPFDGWLPCSPAILSVPGAPFEALQEASVWSIRHIVDWR
jgi:DNA-binding FadR family transcriptional regulator